MDDLSVWQAVEQFLLIEGFQLGEELRDELVLGWKDLLGEDVSLLAVVQFLRPFVEIGEYLL